MFSLRKVIALVCLLAVLVAVLTPSASGLLIACLTLLVSAIGLAPILIVCQTGKSHNLPLSDWIVAPGSRAPPIA